MNKHLAWFLSLAFAGLVPVWAQTAKDLNDDTNRTDATEDRKLNAAYQKLIRQIQNNDKDRAPMLIAELRESQSAWLKYRDAQVQFVGVYTAVGSASARNAGLGSYQTDLTEARIKDLQDVPNPF